MEWLPSGNYQTRSIPIVRSHDPLWDDPDLAENVKAGQSAFAHRARMNSLAATGAWNRDLERQAA